MKSSDKEIKILGVIGNPIKHSLSPLFQNYLLKRYGIPWYYIPLWIDGEGFLQFWKGCRFIKNLAGFNVTLPYKEKAFSFCDILSEEAKVIGAVNTVVCREGVMYGYNTDIDGIIYTVKNKLHLETLDGKKVLIIGAGGAAKAALFALYKLQAKDVCIVNRTLEKAHALMEYGKSFYNMNITVFPFSMLNEAISQVEPHLIINATSIGLNETMEIKVDFQTYLKDLKIFDMVYNVGGTKFVNNAIKFGIEAIDGIYMLVFQGIKSFTLWTGLENIDVEEVITFLKNEVKYRYGENFNNR